jgi:hypothetical protein
MDIIPTDTAIRTMDGPTLTRCAHQLGLAPAGVRLVTNAGPIPSCYDEGRAVVWEPHVDLTQADAVLRKLREYGWNTTVDWSAHYQFGTVSGYRDTEYVQSSWGEGEEVQTEAHALLLVACLIRAAQVGEAEACGDSR